MDTTDTTRAVALHLLQAVLEQHRPLELALDACDGAARDRAAGHRLAAAVLRRLGTLDAVLEPRLRRAPPEAARHVLRLGAAGLLLLDTPAHAAVATSVALVRSAGLAPLAGLVNAVLRGVARDGAGVLEALDGPRLDTPAWLWTSWGEDARSIAVAHLREAPLDVTPRAGGVPWPEATALPSGSWRLPAGTRVSELPGYESGEFWVQDAAAALPARLLAGGPGETVIDLCAAPGGKTAQLAAAGARVIAVERDAARMERLRENLRRLRLACDLVQADATTWLPATAADAVLLDAPCSATGTIRRHPDVPHLKRPRDLAGLTRQQDQMLAQARDMLKPGGRLIYTVCSLQHEEGAARIEAALGTGRWRAAPFEAAEFVGFPCGPTAAGHLRTLPCLWAERGGMDGFFAARLLAV